MELAENQQKANQWCEEDACFIMELEFLKKHAEHRCIKLTGELILQELPGPNFEVSIDEAAAALRRLRIIPMLAEGADWGSSPDGRVGSDPAGAAQQP